MLMLHKYIQTTKDNWEVANLTIVQQRGKNDFRQH